MLATTAAIPVLAEALDLPIFAGQPLLAGIRVPDRAWIELDTNWIQTSSPSLERETGGKLRT